nr:adoMet-dependent rRNA methyltransferase spb1 [Tanacetum cinerariifolium]
MRKASLPEKEVPKPEDVEPEFQVDEAEDKDNRLKKILEDLKNPMQRKRKQAQNEIAKRKERERKRNAVGMKSDVKKDGYADRDLFTKMDTKNYLTEDDGAINDSNCEGSKVDSEDESLTDIDSDEERGRYDE